MMCAKCLFFKHKSFYDLIRLGSRLSGQPCVVYLLATLVTVTADFNNECLCLEVVCALTLSLGSDSNLEFPP